MCRAMQELPVGSTFERLLRLTATEGGLHLANTVDNSGPGATSTYNADTMRNVTIECSEDPEIAADLDCLRGPGAADNVSALCAQGGLDSPACAPAGGSGSSSPLPVWLVATIASGACCACCACCVCCGC